MQIIHVHPPCIFTDQFLRLHFLFDCIDVTLRCNHGGLYGNRACSCSDIIYNCILLNLKFSNRNASYFFLGHRYIATYKCIIRNCRNHRAFATGFIFNIKDRQILSFVMKQWSCCSCLNLFILIRKFCPDPDCYFAHSIFHHFCQDLTDLFCITYKGEYLFILLNDRHQIFFSSMQAY